MNNDTGHTSLNDIARAIARDEPYDAVVRKMRDLIFTDPKIDEAAVLTIARLVVDGMTAQFAFDRMTPGAGDIVQQPKRANKHCGLNWKDVVIARGGIWAFASSARASRAVGGRYEIYQYRHSTSLIQQYESDGPARFEVRYSTTSGQGQWNERWSKRSLLSLAEAKAAAETHHEQRALGIPTKQDQ